jgi:radical SAM superfamily enzyme YgiQ (UPF0313 family)
MKKTLNITLILSADEHDPLRKKDPFMPLSLAILASVAPEHNYRLIDLLWDNLNLDEPADIVGISVRMSAEKAAFRIADMYRKKGVSVVMGGPQPFSNPFEALDHSDAVAIGEGEQLWPVILQDFLGQGLKNFYVCSPRSFEAPGHSVFQLEKLPSLNNLPVPRRDLFKRKYTFDLVFAARGCPINCDFCSVSGLFGTEYRMRPIDDVVNEIRSFKKYYYLIDDTVFGRKNTYSYYLNLYDRIAKLKKIRYWTGQANLDAASNETGREVIKKAIYSGLVYTTIGMESINVSVLKKSGSFSKMGIGQNDDVIEKMKQNIRFIQDQGILISAWFAIGYEDDDLDTYYSTHQLCKEMNLMPVFTPVNALKGTGLYSRLEREHKLQDTDANLTNVYHPSMGNEAVLAALDYTASKGYSFGNIIKRTLFYARKITSNKNNSVNDIIHKTIFVFATQIKMRRIVLSENERLRRKINLTTNTNV